MSKVLQLFLAYALIWYIHGTAYAAASNTMVDQKQRLPSLKRRPFFKRTEMVSPIEFLATSTISSTATSTTEILKEPTNLVSTPVTFSEKEIKSTLSSIETISTKETSETSTLSSTETFSIQKTTKETAETSRISTVMDAMPTTPTETSRVTMEMEDTMPTTSTQKSRTKTEIDTTPTSSIKDIPNDAKNDLSSTLDLLLNDNASTRSNPSGLLPVVSELPALDEMKTESFDDTKISSTSSRKKKPTIKACYRPDRKVKFSQYWIPKENEWDENNEGKRVFLGGGGARVRMLDQNSQVIATAPLNMYTKCRMEGSCLLENGDLINIKSNTSNTFVKVGERGRKQNVFGLGSGAQNLVPFVSVAVNDIPNGQTLYISALDGLDLGENQKHNGCVRVDDSSWSFDACQIDFFVLSYVDYLWLNLENKVSIQFADCKVKNYITKHHLASVQASNDVTIIPSLLTDTYDKTNK